MLNRRRPLGFDFSQIEGFDCDEWTRLGQLYQDRWNWFVGEPWDEQEPAAQSKTGKPVLRFPLQLNLLRLFAAIHAAVLVGEAPEGPYPPIKTVVRPRRGQEPSDELEREAQVAEDFINGVWEQNNGSALQTEAAFLAQFLGGVYFRVTYAPEADLASQIRLELIHPDYVLPIYRTTDYWNLLRIFASYTITAQEATLHYQIKLPSAEWVTYLEDWTRERLEIKVDDKPVETYSGGVATGDKNLFGFVPYVYLPVERAGGFHGLSLVDPLKGLATEYNARMADSGDAISAAVHNPLFGRNLTNIRTLEAGGRVIYDLGRQSAISGSSAGEPNVWRDNGPALPTGTDNFLEQLWRTALRMARLSPIAFGEDEGSQRSALTLAFRMFPVTARARQSRAYFKTGLNLIARYILGIATTKKLLPGREEGWKGWEERLEITQDFAPMIPRDREQEFNELILGVPAGIVSVETAITEQGRVKDVEKERRRIIDWRRENALFQRPQEQQPATDLNEPVATPMTE